jgi:nucleoside-diphosphate-sugar epimerase
MSSERVLVTGASGFIGSRLCALLERDGTEIHAISRTRADGDDGAVRWWGADVADSEAVARVFSSVRPDIVYHLAGRTQAARELVLVRATFDANLAGTVNVLTAAAEAGCGRVLLTGSLEEPDPGTDSSPSSPYAASKWAARAYGRMFDELFGLQVVNLRVFMVYGPGQADVRKLVPYTILSLLRGEAPELSSGTREIDWVYVDDVAAAYVAAARAPGIEGETLDVGSGELVSVREIVERIARLVDPPAGLRFGAAGDRPLEQVRVADVGRTERLAGWRPATSLDEGLARTVDWYSERLGSVASEGNPSNG